MSRRRVSASLSLFRILVFVGSVVCFVSASEYVDTAMPYVAETSSNPTPSEAAKALGPQTMRNARLLFLSGAAGVLIFAASFFIARRRR